MPNFPFIYVIVLYFDKLEINWFFRCVLHFLLQVDQAFTASVESKVTPLTIAVFLKFSSGNSVFFSNFYFTKGKSKITLYIILQSSYASHDRDIEQNFCSCDKHNID